MDSYTEYSSNGMTKIQVCTCGYTDKKMIFDNVELNPSNIQFTTYSSNDVGASKRRNNKYNKTKHKHKRGIHEKK